MVRKKLETYDPKKKITEKIKPFFKPTFKILGIFAIILVTIFATNYVGGKNEFPNLEKFLSNQIIIHSEKMWDSESGKKLSFVGENQDSEEADYSTLSSDLLKSEIIKDLPKGAVLELSFYNFDFGERVWEKTYVLKKDSVEEGTEQSDIQIIMHSKYVRDFKHKSLCGVVIDARNQGDLGIETELTQSALMWKYKNMLKYRDCLGL